MIEEISDEYSIISSFQYFYDHGVEEKSKKWNSDSMLMRILNRYIKSALIEIIKELGFEGDYGIAARSGSSGKWAKTPYVCIIRGKPSAFTKQYSPDSGIYPAYLFSDNCSEIYLSFMIGIGSKNEKELKYCIDTLRKDIGTTPYNQETESMDVGDKHHLYKEATVFFTRYTKGEKLTESRLREDLKYFLAIQKELGEDYYRNLTLAKKPKV